MPKPNDIYDDEGNKLTTFKQLYDYKRKLEAKAQEADSDARLQDAAAADHERNAREAEKLAERFRYDREDARDKVHEITTLLDNWKDE